MSNLSHVFIYVKHITKTDASIATNKIIVHTSHYINNKMTVLVIAWMLCGRLSGIADLLFL